MPGRINDDADLSRDVSEDEEYDENEDEDFRPEAAGDGEDVSSSSDEGESHADTSKTPRTSAKKRKADDSADANLDSGDEATIKEQRKRKKRKNDTAADGGDEDSEGEGQSFVRTRAQRQADKEQRKQHRRTVHGTATIDVDQVWAELSGLPLGRPAPGAAVTGLVEQEADDKENANHERPPGGSSETIKIVRRIKYAGEVTEVEEEVPRDSEAAQEYLKEHPEADPDRATNDSPANGNANALQRPLKRMSLFEPNPAGLVKGVPPDRLRPHAPSRQDVLLMERRAEELRKKKAEKMTTVQKSALDWKSYVDKQGLKEELDEYGKSKSTFLAREAFLDRAQAVRDDRARDARLKT